MANDQDHDQDESVAAWAKRCYFAGRAVMESLLREHDLGTTQWYVLHHLAHRGPSMQRELVRALQIERATLSVVVGTLVRKRLIKQVPDRVDQRQKRLEMTAAGTRLWKRLPDLGSVIRRTAFANIDDADIETAVSVLRTATQRLHGFSKRETKP